jgi:DedD protein
MRRYTIDLNATNPAATSADPPATQPAVTLPEPVPASEQQSQLAKPGEDAAPATTQPSPAPAPAPAPVRAPAVAAAAAPPVTAPAPVEQAPVKAPAEQPAPRVEAPNPAATAPAERGSFVVQLGSFGSRDNADRLVRDMTAKGFAAFVAPIKSGGRELYRVRVGPTRDRAQAEALAAQLRRIGQSGSIVPIS